eukprot:7269935-Prorocentrum_lima.AAC.1
MIASKLDAHARCDLRSHGYTLYKQDASLSVRSGSGLYRFPDLDRVNQDTLEQGSVTQVASICDSSTP